MLELLSNPIVTLILGIIISVITGIVINELTITNPTTAENLLKRLSKNLPEKARDDFLNSKLGDLDSLIGPWRKLGYALSTWCYMPSTYAVVHQSNIIGGLVIEGVARYTTMLKKRKKKSPFTTMMFLSIPYLGFLTGIMVLLSKIDPSGLLKESWVTNAIQLFCACVCVGMAWGIESCLRNLPLAQHDPFMGRTELQRIYSFRANLFVRLVMFVMSLLFWTMLNTNDVMQRLLLHPVFGAEQHKLKSRIRELMQQEAVN